MGIQVNYLTRDEFDRLSNRIGGALLCVIGYDAPCPDWVPLGCPFAQLDMAPLMEQVYEVWTALPGEVWYDAARGFAVARGPGVIMALIEPGQPGSQSLDGVMREVYERIFDLTQGAGQNLHRIWNYIPDITGDEDGMERYRRFNTGRGQAFDAAPGAPEIPPAASALGSRSGDPLLYFLAGDRAGSAIENPRQVSAYDYPPQYGPRSPAFSRATLGPAGGGQMLFVSGTASVVGHESLHSGDVAAQTRESIANLQAVFREAAGQDYTVDMPRAAFKIYLRHKDDLDIVRTIVRQHYPRVDNVIYLQADICRHELLIEIEAFVPDVQQK